MTRAMSPRTRRSFTTIRPVLDSRATPMVTLGSPPPPQPTSEATPSSPTPDLEDPVLALTDHFDAF